MQRRAGAAYVTAIALLGVIGCNSLGGRPPRVIFTAEHAAAIAADSLGTGFKDSDFMPPGPYWTPQFEEIRAFERKLDQEMVRLGNQRWFRQYHRDFSRPRVRQYGIQFLGIERNGVKLIYANGYCTRSSYTWSSWNWAFDGGACYFGATYNPATGELEGPGFNGYA